MPDQTPPLPPIPFPPIEEIERAGRTEARRQARLLFDEMMANGGRVDIDRLQSLGPDVQHAYIRLLSRRAAGTAAASAKPSATAPKLGRRRPRRKVAKQTAARSKPRTDKHWAPLRCALPNVFRRAVGFGLCASVLGCVFVAYVIRYFEL